MKTLIIDDERLARSELRSLLRPYNNIEIVGECSNVQEALDSVKSFDPELLFLDINMPEKSGFDLLGELDKTPHVVFVTAHDEYAIKAFDHNALDYLLKPVDPDRLKETIEKLTTKANRTRKNESQPERTNLTLDDRIFIKDGESCWFVKLKEVHLFESEGNYVRVNFEENRPLILKSLNQLQENLSPQNFFRANRKQIINLSFVDSITPWFNGRLMIQLSTDKEIEVSRRQAVKFRDLMGV